jgi:NTE family protein
VLDLLLDDGRLAIEGISATSAGAVNAVVCASGMLQGGRAGARRALEGFWRAVADAGATYQPNAAAFVRQLSQPPEVHGEHIQDLLQLPGQAWATHMTGLMELNPFFRLMSGKAGTRPEPPSRSFARFLSYVASTMSSPYYFNPGNVNPLKRLIEAHVDFEALRRAPDALKPHICAPNVETGKIRIFKNAELSADAVLASTCLPLLFQAVEIDGQYYWDGGFMGNPAIFPVIYACEARDIVLVHLTPTERPGTPMTGTAIYSRMQEVAFNSSLMREMRAVAFVTDLIDSGKMTDGKRMLIHAIDGEDVIGTLSNSSKLNGNWGFLTYLHQTGRERADEWLKANFDRIGVETTVDMRARYL